MIAQLGEFQTASHVRRSVEISFGNLLQLSVKLLYAADNDFVKIY